MYVYVLGNEEEQEKLKRALREDIDKQEKLLFVQDPENAEMIYVLKGLDKKYKREIEENLHAGRQVCYREAPAVRRRVEREYGIGE